MPVFVLLMIFIMNACQVADKPPAAININIDTLRTAVITFTPAQHWYFFDSTYKAATLTSEELQVIDSFLLAGVTNFNNLLGEQTIDLVQDDYKKQLVAISNNKGEKEVWVNCFCNPYDNWRTDVISVDDGGSCYFSFKINLTLHKYYDFDI